ncbi:MAG: hypothetical protein ACSHW7_02195 [Patiriisocius sp.]|uniref:hypothetical protein n=1 Tax=Patiriisocius sp. TaxID=2822396 RepID=UPI003EF3B001
MKNSATRISFKEILAKPTSKVLAKYDVPTDYSNYSSQEIRDAENDMVNDFNEFNKYHEEAQESMAEELANITV